jgi:hypothetical protein
MTVPWAIIIIVVALILLFVVIKIIKSCLPKIVFGIIILAAIAYAAYYFLTR